VLYCAIQGAISGAFGDTIPIRMELLAKTCCILLPLSNSFVGAAQEASNQGFAPQGAIEGSISGAL
jgi:hypothetical protein